MNTLEVTTTVESVQELKELLSQVAALPSKNYAVTLKILISDPAKDLSFPRLPKESTDTAEKHSSHS